MYVCTYLYNTIILYIMQLKINYSVTMISKVQNRIGSIRLLGSELQAPVEWSIL